MDYGNILKRAGEITWRYKFLWIFGFIMAMCGQGGGRSRFQTNYRTSIPIDSETGMSAMPDFPAFFPEPLGQTPIILLIVAILLLVLFFMFISIAVGAIGRSALIKSVDRVETGEDISLKTSWKDGLSKALPMGLQQFLLSLPTLILVLAMFAIFFGLFWSFMSDGSMTMRPRFDMDSPGPPPQMDTFFTILPLLIASMCGFICVIFIIQIFVGIFLTFGGRAIVLEDKGVIASLGRGWSVFRQNLAPSIILAIIAAVLSATVSLAIAIPAMLLMIPVFLSTMPALVSGAGPPIGSILLLVVAGIIVFLVTVFVGGIMRVYLETLWTLAYREFTQ